MPTGEKAPQGTELKVTLRKHQARFLFELSAATERDSSTICQHLINTAHPGQGPGQDSFLIGPAARASALSFAPQRGDKRWTQISVYLPPACFNQLCSIAAQTKSSASTAMRSLIAQYMERSGIANIAPRSPRRVVRRKLGPPRLNGTIALIVAAASTLLGILVYAFHGDETEVRAGPHWAGLDASLILDPHTHTSYSDGTLSPSELVQLAVEEGCDALVISDHSDSENSVSDQQLAEIQALRDHHTGLLLFNGLGLRMPSHEGREHAGLVASPHVEADVLQSLRELAERSVRGAKKTGAHDAYDQQVLEKISNYQSLHTGLLLFYNHPSRNDEHASENVADINRWNSVSPIFTALEGGPGHQKANGVAAFSQTLANEDHWDPAVATIGGAWDQLLSEGRQIWGALASSDYHNDTLDYPPCQFSRTHLIVPEQSYRGVLMALQAGTFWADNGQILNQLDLSVRLEELEKPVYPGYVVRVKDRESKATVQLSVTRAPATYGKPLSAEIIGNCQSGEAELLAVRDIPAEKSSASAKVALSATGRDGESCIIRSRVRLGNNESNDLLAYTNHIRFLLE